MRDPAITEFTSLDISGKKGFYVPELTTRERDNIPVDIMRNGGLIYNTDNNMLQTSQNGNWLSLMSSSYSNEIFRSGTIKVGNVGVVTGDLHVTGCILSATARAGSMEGDTDTVVDIKIADKGYAPLAFISILETNTISTGNDIYVPQVVVTQKTSMSIYLEKIKEGESVSTSLCIMLIAPDLT